MRACVHARHILPNQFHTDVTDTSVFLVDRTISRSTLFLSHFLFGLPPSLSLFPCSPVPFSLPLPTTQGYIAALSRSKAIFEVPTGANYRATDLVTSNGRDESAVSFRSFQTPPANIYIQRFGVASREENFTSSSFARCYFIPIYLPRLICRETQYF